MCVCKVQLASSDTNTALEVAALNSIISIKGLGLAPVTNQTLAALLGNPASVLLLTATGLYPLKLNAGAVATCTTATIPVGNYTGIQLALASMSPPLSLEYVEKSEVSHSTLPLGISLQISECWLFALSSSLLLSAPWASLHWPRPRTTVGLRSSKALRLMTRKYAMPCEMHCRKVVCGGVWRRLRVSLAQSCGWCC